MDGIAFSGELFGQILAAAGQEKEAATVLDMSADAYEKLGYTDHAEGVRNLCNRILEAN